MITDTELCLAILSEARPLGSAVPLITPRPKGRGVINMIAQKAADELSRKRFAWAKMEPVISENKNVKARILRRAAFEHGRTIREQAEHIGGIPQEVIKLAEQTIGR